jgi:hypothetical protein
MDCIDLFKKAAAALQTDPRYLELDAADIGQRRGLVIRCQCFGSGIIMGIGQLFQLNSPYPKRPHTVKWAHLSKHTISV